MKKMIGIIMMITGGILFVGGYFVYANKEDLLTKEGIEEQIKAIVADGVFTNKEKAHIGKLAEKHSLNKEDLIAEVNERINANTEEAETEIIDQDKKKGDDFEMFIVKKFNQKYFKIKQWAGDKYVDGIYSEKTLQPDIIIEYTNYDYKKKFAVECKYRSNSGDNIKLSYESQLERYKAFEKENGIDVYIALGIGGKASKPADLYLIPLAKLSNPYISIKKLEKYKKEVGANFYLFTDSEVLTISYPPEKN